MRGRLSTTSSTCSLARPPSSSSSHPSEADSLAALLSPSSRAEPDALALPWHSTVTTYSKLTHGPPADRLVALPDPAGCSSRSRLQKAPPSPAISRLSCAGLWPSILPASLLWFVVYGKRHLPTGTVPSWSWASISGGYVSWDALWPRSEVPWPLGQKPEQAPSLAHDAPPPQQRGFPRLDGKLRILRARSRSSEDGGPVTVPIKGVITLRCTLCPVLAVADMRDCDRTMTGGRVFQGCIIADARARKAVRAGLELPDRDWVATQLRVWEDLGWSNDQLKLLFDLRLSPAEFAAVKYEVLYCVRFYEYAPSSVSWGHHDGLLLRRRAGSTNDEYERVGLWKCTQNSMFDDKYQVINLV
ncbi:het domain protein pin-c3 [Diplodia corticola]|uniref:Het domain protein pin-c3 n=1 Tax=Diplodia corticola TaxID=236234 RepID=A0A1J9RTI0_9PEZI|nr:het domain protein pin-c3 [Diplodia corticola]OJD30829.1 het domain protein pin-c3 [Diplodia corticola]